MLRSLWLVALAAFNMLAVQLVLKKGVAGGPPVEMSAPADILALATRVLTTPLLILGYALSVVNSLVWIMILSRMEVSLAVPLMMGIYFLMLLIASRMLLHEVITPARFAGTLLIAVGVWFISCKA